MPFSGFEEDMPETEPTESTQEEEIQLNISTSKERPDFKVKTDATFLFVILWTIMVIAVVGFVKCMCCVELHSTNILDEYANVVKEYRERKELYSKEGSSS